MRFETFLKKKGYREWNPKTKKTGKITSLSVKSLGEWAFEQLSLFVFLKNDFDILQKYSIHKDFIGHAWTIYWKIALVCLGEKEIRKRLKEKSSV